MQPVSDTFAGYRTKVRRYLHENKSSTSWWSDDFLGQMFNAQYRKRCSQLTAAFEGFFSMEVSTPVTAGEGFYDWPNGFERLIKLELYVVADGTRVPIQRWERHYSGVAAGAPVLVDFLPTYRPVGGGFLLEPAFTEGSAPYKALESFEDAATNFTASTDCVVSNNTTNYKEGGGAIQLDKTGTTANPATVYVERTTLTYDFSESAQASYWVYLPTVSSSIINDATKSVVLRLTSDAGANYSEYYTARANLVQGWNYITVDLNDPDATFGAGVTQGAVTGIRITFGITTQSTKIYGLLVDGLAGPASAIDSQFNMILEYIGVPTLLIDDNDRLHPEFPTSFDELLVLDTACSAMSAESALESGIVRALERERANWEEAFLRYIDSRITSSQGVDPMVGHYIDA